MAVNIMLNGYMEGYFDQNLINSSKVYLAPVKKIYNLKCSAFYEQGIGSKTESEAESSSKVTKCGKSVYIQQCGVVINDEDSRNAVYEMMSESSTKIIVINDIEYNQIGDEYVKKTGGSTAISMVMGGMYENEYQTVLVCRVVRDNVFLESDNIWRYNEYEATVYELFEEDFIETIEAFDVISINHTSDVATFGSTDIIYNSSIKKNIQLAEKKLPLSNLNLEQNVTSMLVDSNIIMIDEFAMGLKPYFPCKSGGASTLEESSEGEIIIQDDYSINQTSLNTEDSMILEMKNYFHILAPKSRKYTINRGILKFDFSGEYF